METINIENNSTKSELSKVPDIIRNYRYAGEKLNEIKTLIESIKNPINKKLVFQSLPRHMRRRTMTHNVKRLPRKYRSAHLSQMQKSGLPLKTKRPSRKFRRKPSNLMMEYIRRQRKNIWLETHIWHAKRFHMTERWGYKLPVAPCDKSFRACYRATTKHCLLQDISYYGCIEITGPIDLLKSTFEKITNQECGKSITAKIYINGIREGSIDIFRENSYPNNPIGRVSFIWKPNPNESNPIRTIWIFAHAAFYQEVLDEIIKIFHLIPVPKSEDIDMEPNEIPKYIAKHYNFNRTPKFSNKEVTLTELKDTINRFRLTGPLSQAVLNKALKCKSIDENFINKSESWIKEYFFDTKKQYHEIQTNYWNSLTMSVTSPSELPPNLILALNIEDPRLNRPKKRTKSVIDAIDFNFNNDLLSIPKYLNESPSWDFGLRNNLVRTMMPTHKLCELRNQNCLVPGEKCEFENNIQPVPVLLIQRPGSQNGVYKQLGYGCGWDIIIPAGYGISTWMCMIMWGARAGGLRESRSILRESGIDEFLPDTNAGAKEMERKCNELKRSYFRKPQNKRPNYKKFGIATPFHCPWKQLISDWQEEPSSVESFHVIRDQKTLEKLQMILNNDLMLSKITLSENSLIPVYLSMIKRGCAKDYSIICLPKKIDVKTFLRFKRNSKNNPIYVEPLKTDPNEKERKKLRKEHLKLLKRLRNRRVREKRKKQETAKCRVRIRKPETKELIEKQFRKMCNLWLNDEEPESVRDQCSREVFGYLTQSEFSYTESKGCGIGYITVQGYKKLLGLYCSITFSNKMMVLVRSPGTRNYRCATIKIRML